MTTNWVIQKKVTVCQASSSYQDSKIYQLLQTDEATKDLIKLIFMKGTQEVMDRH